MDIRLAALDDLAAIRACARAAYQMYVARIGREPAPMIADFAQLIEDGVVHVIADDDHIAGFAVYYPRGDHLHLENVAVDPKVQGRGLGKQLIRHVEQAARDEGISAIELYTNARMAENLKLYPKLGYSEIGRWTEDGFDRVFYRKELADRVN